MFASFWLGLGAGRSSGSAARSEQGAAFHLQPHPSARLYETSHYMKNCGAVCTAFFEARSVSYATVARFINKEKSPNELRANHHRPSCWVCSSIVCRARVTHLTTIAFID